MRDGATAVIALGGNTLLGGEDEATFDAQRAVIAETAAGVVDAVEAGVEVVLTYGNGPQVGQLLLQQERTPEVPRLPLDVLVAQTQAWLGYLLQQALDNELASGQEFLTVVTQVLVDPADPAFDDPTKPVGPFYTAAEAHEQPFETRRVRDGERPFRRVVPSPEPLAVVEGDEIAAMVARGNLVVCAGGGGIPVVRDGGLRGVEAVVDKDRTSAVLASTVDADRLVLLTDVEHAFVDFGGPDQRPIERVDAGTLRGHLEAGEFGVGSMRPKVEACLRFVEAGGEQAVITTPERLDDALAGTAGTRVEA